MARQLSIARLPRCARLKELELRRPRLLHLRQHAHGLKHLGRQFVVDLDRAIQNVLGRPASFRMPFAVNRDFSLRSTVT